jgi:hypothetical protein
MSNGLYYASDTYWTKQKQFAKVFYSYDEAIATANEYANSHVVE